MVQDNKLNDFLTQVQYSGREKNYEEKFESIPNKTNYLNQIRTIKESCLKEYPGNCLWINASKVMMTEKLFQEIAPYLINYSTYRFFPHFERIVVDLEGII